MAEINCTSRNHDGTCQKLIVKGKNIMCKDYICLKKQHGEMKQR